MWVTNLQEGKGPACRIGPQGTAPVAQVAAAWDSEGSSDSDGSDFDAVCAPVLGAPPASAPHHKLHAGTPGSVTLGMAPWLSNLLAAKLAVHLKLCTLATATNCDHLATRLRSFALQGIKGWYTQYHLSLAPPPTTGSVRSGTAPSTSPRRVLLHNLLPRRDFVSLSKKCLQDFTEGGKKVRYGIDWYNVVWLIRYGM